MKSPFKFLDSYTKDDRDIFFGRDREIEELYQKVFDSKLLLVYGVSGTGKSSLIHCGLANKFRETDWLPLVVRRGTNIIESMAVVIKEASITKQPFKFTNPAEFKKSVRSLYLDHYKPVFFIFDQFEELFIFGEKEERKSFVQIVKSLIETDLQCRLIFVMREEYMAGVTEFEKYIPTFFANRVRIEKMSHVNAIEAIRQPCKVFNITIEEGFAESLLEKLSPESADVELTFLQVFLDKIFRFALSEKTVSPGTPILTGNLLELIGNVSDLLGDFLDEQISLLENPSEGLAILKSFVSIKGSRRQIGMEEVAEYAKTLGQPLKENGLKELLQRFIDLRILCDKDQNDKYELRHDALATKIYEKITLVEKEVLEVRQFIDNAYIGYKKRGVYFSSDDLNYIVPYESRLFLSKELSGLIDESRRRLTRVKRRRRNIILVSAIAIFVVLTGFTIWALNEKNKADKAGFRQLESILKLNENFEKVKKSQSLKKDEIYQMFEMTYLTYPYKLGKLWDKALTIKKTSNELTEYIYQLEFKMLSESEYISSDSARKTSLTMVRNKSNSKIPYQILFRTNGDSGLSNVSLLKEKIQNYRKIIYAQIDKKDWDKINFNIDTEKSFINDKGESVSWEKANFGETILAGAITNLNNLITEINYIELDAINLIYSWITFGSFAFNTIMPIVIPQSNYVTVGGSYEATLMLSAFDTRTNMEAYIFEGRKDTLSEAEIQNTSNMIPLTSKFGKIKISLPANNLGHQRIDGFISVKTPDGSSNKYVFATKYTVGEPVIFIAPRNMNVLYLGVDNPIDINIPGVSLDSVKVKLSHGALNKKDGHFMVRPSKMEECEMTVISVNKNGTTISYPPLRFRVKMKPDPIISIEGINEDNIKKDDLLSSKKLIAYYPSDFDFGVSFTVTGFTTAIIRNGQIVKASSNNDLFSIGQRKLIAEMKKGDKLYIQDIIVQVSDGSVLSIKGLIYSID